MAEVFTPIVGTFIFVVYRKFYCHELPSSVNIYNYGCAVNCSATYRLTYSLQINYNNFVMLRIMPAYCVSLEVRLYISPQWSTASLSYLQA